MPIGCVNVGEGPRNIRKADAADYPRITVNVTTIVIVDEVVPKRLAKDNPDNDHQQNADYSDDYADVMTVRVATGTMRFRCFLPLHPGCYCSRET